MEKPRSRVEGEQIVQVIPVIDVRHGVAVRAEAGDRANYQPLRSPLAATPDPIDVARSLMALHPFPVIYVADLDGIEGRGANAGLAPAIASATGATVWLDRGIGPAEYGVGSFGAGLLNPNIVPVLGSESGWDVAALAGLNARQRSASVLSLDFRGETFVGNADLLDRADLWPDRVVVMTLGQVGRAGGPDLPRLAGIARLASTKRSIGAAPVSLYAAGGVRNRSDLTVLSHAGIAGALVATALHSQTLTADDLQEVTGR